MKKLASFNQMHREFIYLISGKSNVKYFLNILIHIRSPIVGFFVLEDLDISWKISYKKSVQCKTKGTRKSWGKIMIILISLLSQEDLRELRRQEGNAKQCEVYKLVSFIENYNHYFLYGISSRGQQSRYCAIHNFEWPKIWETE